MRTEESEIKHEKELREKAKEGGQTRISEKRKKV